MVEQARDCKDVLVSIVNGNRSGLIQKAVESVYEHTRSLSFDVVVIDNATGYQGLDALRDLGAEVRVNALVAGFAANHSQVLPLLDRYRYLLLFNDDAFLENDALQIMVDAMDADPAVAITGCRIDGVDGRLQPNAAPFPGIRYFVGSLLGIDRAKGERYSRFFARYIDYGKSQDVDWVTGCCMLIRTGFIREHGFLDRRFFMYLEDADICRRAWGSGRRVRYVAEARAVHYGGLSSRTERNKTNPKIFLERQKSRLVYLRRYAPAQWVLFALFVNLFIAAKLVARSLQMRWNEARELVVLLRGRPIW